MKLLLAVFVSLSSTALANQNIFEVQARTTSYYDVQTTLNNKTDKFTSNPNGEKSHFKRYTDQIDTHNTVTVCFILKANAPKAPSPAKGLAVALVNLYQNGKKTEVLRNVAPLSTQIKGGKDCTEYSFNLFADTTGYYKVMDMAMNDQLEPEEAVKKKDDDEEVAVMKNKLPPLEGREPASEVAVNAASDAMKTAEQKLNELKNKLEEAQAGVAAGKTGSTNTIGQKIDLPKMPDWVSKFFLWIVIGTLGFSLLLVISVWRVFNKAGENGGNVLVPILNFYTTWKISGTSQLFLLLVLGPSFVLTLAAKVLSTPAELILSLVAAFGYLVISLGVARSFGKGRIFGIGLWLMPFLFYPVLAFSSSDFAGRNFGNLGSPDNNEDTDPNLQLEKAMEELQGKTKKVS
jgi:hypothetical protein